MITAHSAHTPLGVAFSNGRETGRAETTPDKGGTGEGFRPHELLEAALATCMGITVRMYARDHGIPLDDVAVTVTLDGSREGGSVFRYSLEFQGDLTEAQREKLARAAAVCPVKRTLSKTISFEAGTE